MKAQLEAATEEQGRMEQQGKQFETAEQKLKYLRTIAGRLSNPAWDELTTKVGQCLPDQVWLDRIIVDTTGKMQLGGLSFTEEGVFEFEKWLNQLPSVREVSLFGTDQTTYSGGSAVSFNIKCEVVGAADDAANKGPRNGND